MCEISQEASGWRRTQHHLKAQLDHSSFFSSMGTRHPQTRSILQESSSSEPSPQPTSGRYFLLAPSCCSATPWTLWAYTEAIHDDIYLRLKTLCNKGCGQKKKIVRKKSSNTSCSLAQQFALWGVYRLLHCPLREAAPFLKSHPLNAYHNPLIYRYNHSSALTHG